MPVLSMNEVSWDDTNISGNKMISNGQEMTGLRHHTSGPRSQDDAMVGYFFQRPQHDGAQPYNSKRWAVGDDSVIEQVRVLIVSIISPLGEINWRHRRTLIHSRTFFCVVWKRC